MTALLEVNGLRAGYGRVRVLHGLDLTVAQGEIVAVLGANGTGKTTTLRAISGMIPVQGSVTLAGTQVAGSSPEALVRQGVVHVPEGRGTFASLSVEENLRLGAHTRGRADSDEDRDSVYEYFPVLQQRRAQTAGNLSGGEQQMLAIGRALMARPRLLLLDEPSLGLAPQVTRTVFSIVTRINAERDVTIVLVEQNAELALRHAHRAYVIESGRVALTGTAQDVSGDEDIRRVYLGY
jgi:branched-chain amino acid transport system ATP-binding protein